VNQRSLDAEEFPHTWMEHISKERVNRRFNKHYTLRGTKIRTPNLSFGMGFLKVQVLGLVLQDSYAGKTVS